MLPTLLSLVLFCFSIDRVNSLERHHAVVDLKLDGKALRGNVHVNGSTYALKLKAAEDSVFAPSFRLTETIRSASGRITLREIPLAQHASELERNIYVDEHSNAALAMEHVDGEIRLRGVMDNIHISHDGQHHFATIHGLSSFNSTSDYRFAGASWKTGDSVSNGQVTVATPELFITVDQSSYIANKKDEKKILVYLAILIRAVNNRFKTVSDPSVKFRIVGSTILKTMEDQPFIEEAKGDDDAIDTKSALIKFAAYMYNLRQTNGKDLPEHDIAPLISGDKFRGREGGRANRAGACQDGPVGGKTMGSQRTLVTRDEQAGWIGFHRLTHELAHNIGAPHDGEDGYDKFPYYDTTACPASDGYIMSYEWNPPNRLTFSKCSIDYMKEFINSKDGACLKENVAPPSQVLPEAPEDPGRFLSMDQQCEMHMWDRYDCEFAKVDPKKSPDELCQQLFCACPGFEPAPVVDARALDGTPCGTNGGRCIEEKCVE